MHHLCIFWFLFCSKIIFDQKLFSYRWDKFDYPVHCILVLFDFFFMKAIESIVKVWIHIGEYLMGVYGGVKCHNSEFLAIFLEISRWIFFAWWWKRRGNNKGCNLSITKDVWKIFNRGLTSMKCRKLGAFAFCFD